MIIVPKYLQDRAEGAGIIVPAEMFEFIDTMVFGSGKHAPNNWLDPNGIKTSHRDMHASLFRHTAQSSCGVTTDHESGKHPILHAMCRAGMYYTRWKRGLVTQEKK